MSDRKLRADLIRLASTYPARSNERRQLLDLVKQAEAEEQVPTPPYFNDSETFPAEDVADEKPGPLEQVDATPQAKADVAGEFTQQEFSELGDRVESDDMGDDASRMASDFDPNEIAEEKPGPEESEKDEPWMQGEFTQQENSEMESIQERDQWGKVKAFLVRQAHTHPELRKAALDFIAGCEKLPAGKMRDMCEKKDKSNDNDGKDSDGDGKDKDKAKSDGKMPKELLEKFKGKKAAEYPWDQCIKDQMKQYGNKETAEKVCGKIKSMSGKQAFQMAASGETIKEAAANAYRYARGNGCTPDEAFLLGRFAAYCLKQ